MDMVSTIGLDLAKNVFQVHGADASGKTLWRKKLRRAQVLEFFAAQPICRVAMEACGGAHFWGREIAKLGHEVRLIAPAYVKPFVKLCSSAHKRFQQDGLRRRVTFGQRAPFFGRRAVQARVCSGAKRQGHGLPQESGLNFRPRMAAPTRAI